MYIRHIDPYGNELGLYRSIKEAANNLKSDVKLLSTLLKHNLTFQDGSILKPTLLSKADRKIKRELKRRAVDEYIRIGTHYRFLARKYNLTPQEVTRAIEKHRAEQNLHLAYSEWLATGEAVEKIANRYEVSRTKLHRRINRRVEK